MNAEQMFPASSVQRAHWLMHELDPDGHRYIITWAVNVARRVDPVQAQAAVAAVVARHGALRTRFVAVDGVPFQVVADRSEIRVDVVDLRPDAGARQSAAHQTAPHQTGTHPARTHPARTHQEGGLVSVRRRFAEEPFDLSQGPLFRVALVRLGDEEQELLLGVHHSVADARSLELISAELVALLAGGTPAPTPAPQYADHARGEQDRLDPATTDRLLTYWTGQLAGVPWKLDLPTDRQPSDRQPSDRQRGDAAAPRGGNHPLRLDEELLERLAVLARRHHTTVFVVLLAATGVLLARHSGQESVLVATPMSTRNRRESADLVGPLVNTVALRVDTGDDPDVSTLLGRLRGVVIDALAHSGLPFGELVTRLRPDRVPGLNPLVQVMLALHERPQDALPPWVSTEFVERRDSDFDLAFTVSAARPETSRIEYRADRYDPARIADLAEQFDVLVRALIARPETPVSRLPLLSPAAEHRALVEWNATGVERPVGGVAGFVEEQVRRTPDAVAVVSGDRQVSYRDLNRMANRLARTLIADGVRREDRVALCAGRSIGLVVGILAAFKAGAAVVPVEPCLPPRRRDLLLAASEARVVLAEPGLLDGSDSGCSVLSLRDPDGAEVDSGDDEDPGVVVHPDQLAYVLYTSGSTGEPKGVSTTHRGVVNYVHWCVGEFALESGMGAPLFGSVGFDTTVMTSLLPPLFCGERVHLFGGRAGPAVALAELAESDVDFSYVALTPSQLQMVVAQRAGRPFRARLLVVGGEMLHADMLPLSADGTPAHRVINEYGPTETVAACCAYPLPRGAAPPDEAPIGGPIWNLAAYVLDRHGAPVPVGVAGELFIGGAGVARGYLGRPGLTAAAFVPAPGGGRMYRTGDRARYRPDGVLEFLGRLDDQVKIRGIRTEPGEVRAALAAAPGVRDCAVLARPGGDGTELIAYVVASAPADALHEYLSGVLPPQLLPAGYVFLDALPVTANGKLEQSRLAGHPVRPTGQARFVAPVGPTEPRVAALWGELLGLSRVGAIDDFFAAGGHSVTGARLLARIREEFGVAIPLHALFDDPTVRGLAGLIGAEGVADDAVRPAEEGRSDGAVPGPGPLSLAQEGLWFASRLRPADTGLNTCAAYRLRGPLRRDDMVAAVTEVIRRHDLLRAVVVEADGEPSLNYLPADQVEVRTADLTGDPAPARRAQEIIDADAVRPFDLAAGPLIRPWLLRLGDRDHILALIIHHLVVDGRSMDVLVRDLTACYTGETRPSAGAVRYADFVTWQRARLEPSELERQAAYWTALLADPPGPLAWPSGTEPSGTEHAGTVRTGAEPAGARRATSRHEVRLPAGMHQDLEQLSRDCGVTLFTTLLTGFGVLLHREAAQDDIVIATPLDLRRGPDTEDLVGLLINMVALRLRLDDRPTGRDLLLRTHQQVLGAHRNPDLPLAAVVERTRPERARSGRTALGQVMFSLQYEADPVPELDGLRAEPLAARREDAVADLILALECGPDGMVARFTFDPAVLSLDTVTRFGDRLGRLLTAMAAGPDTPVGTWPTTTADERELLLRWSHGG